MVVRRGKVNESGGSGALGSLSKKYESGENGPGTIGDNDGDIGGASYGTYQIATNTGTMNNFLSWAGKNAPMVANALKGKKPGTQEFNQTWTQLAQENPQGFESIQHQFIKGSHYDPAVNRVKKSTGFDPNTHSQAVQDAFWSTAVHHGVAGAERVIKGAGIKPGMSDTEIIDRLYAERGANNGMKYFPSSSDSIRKSVLDRFENERRDARSMLT